MGTRLPRGERQARETLAEVKRRLDLRALQARLPSIGDRVAEGLFDKQRPAWTDESRNLTLCLPRRAGKTDLMARRLLALADKHPRAVCPYITMTRGTAKLIMWPRLKELDYKLGLNLAFNETELKAFLPNGSMVLCTGADDEKEINKLRGGGYPGAGIDEAQAFGGFLKVLVEDVLGPAMLDYRGQIIMAGTPNAACAGYFFEASTGLAGRWTNHHWTMLDNPHLKDAQEFLDGVLKDRNWSADSPQYRREYFGEWVRSDESLVYRFRLERDVVDVLPAVDEWFYGLSVDVGFDDPTAFTLTCWSKHDPCLYYLDAWKRSGMTVSDVAAAINRYIGQRRLQYIVIDQGGLGKMIAEEFRTRFNIPCEQAEKKAKHDAIEVVNSDFERGHVKFLRGKTEQLTDEIRLLQWDPERNGFEDERFPNDLADSFLYNSRKARHYLYKEPAVQPPRGTDAYYQAEDKRLRQRLERGQLDRKKAKWWET